MGAVGDEMAAGLEDFVIARDVGARRAGVGDDDRIARQYTMQLGEHALGPNRACILGGELVERLELRLARARDRCLAVEVGLDAFASAGAQTS